MGHCQIFNRIFYSLLYNQHSVEGLKWNQSAEHIVVITGKKEKCWLMPLAKWTLYYELWDPCTDVKTIYVSQNKHEVNLPKYTLIYNVLTVVPKPGALMAKYKFSGS